MPEPIRVLITSRFKDEQLERLRAISPLLQITQKSVNRDMDDPGSLFDGYEQVMYGLRPPRDLSVAPHLNWVQLHSAGVNHLVDHPIWKTGIQVTNASGIHAIPIAEAVFAYMLALARQVPRIVRLKERSEWPKDKWNLLLGTELRDQVLGIVGYGSIGREVARIGKQGFGMRILALKRLGVFESSRYQQAGVGDPTGELPDLWLRPDQLHRLLQHSDFVVVSLPLTAETRGMIGERELRAMKPTSFLVNIARGQLLDEAALARALREGWIAGAALDTFAQEPLPRDSALWKLENVIISPHVASATPQYDDRAVELFGENLRRYLDGRSLLNLVDREGGY